MNTKLILILAAVLIITGCNRAPKAEAPGEKTQTVFAVNVTTAVSGELKNYLRVNGDVKNTSTVDVVPETAGKVVNLLVSLGSKVTAGQVVAEVDPSRPGMEFVASPVRAPISGTVIATPASLGATVSPQVPIIRISRGTETRLVADIAERYIASIRVGLSGIVSFEAFPGESWVLRITEVAPEVDPLSRTLQIKMVMDNPDPRIRVGMFGRVKLVTEAKTRVVKIQSEAVIQRLGASYVFVVKDTVVERRKVIPGLAIDGKTEILEGLQAGETVVIRGQTLLDEGSAVKVIDRVPSLPPADQVN